MAVSSLAPASFAEEAGTEAAVQAEEAANPAGSEQQEAAEAQAEAKEQAQPEPAPEEAAQEPAAEEAPAQPEAAPVRAAESEATCSRRRMPLRTRALKMAAQPQMPEPTRTVRLHLHRGLQPVLRKRQARKKRGHPAVLPPKGQAMHLRSKIRWRRLHRSIF